MNILYKFILVLGFFIILPVQASNGLLNEHQKLIAQSGANDDEFGYSVAVDGDTAVVGAAAANSDNGKVYIYKKQSGSWTYEQTLDISGSYPDSFGFGGSVVVVDNQWIAVGAPKEEIGSTQLAGAVYIFKKIGASWQLEQRITSDSVQFAQYFGHSLAMNSSRLAIGTFTPINNNGAVFIYEPTTNPVIVVPWEFEVKFTPSDGGEGLFGFDVAMDGDNILVGDPGGKGAVYLYFYQDEFTFPNEEKFTASDGLTDDAFGASVDLQNGLAAIGAPGIEIIGGAATSAVKGKVYLISTSLFYFETIVEDVSLNIDAYFGIDVRLEGSNLFIAAPGYDDPDPGLGSGGRVYWHTINGGGNNLYRILQATVGFDGNTFGWSIAYDGDSLIVGAPYDSNANGFSAGSAFYFLDDLIFYSGFE